MARLCLIPGGHDNPFLEYLTIDTSRKIVVSTCITSLFVFAFSICVIEISERPDARVIELSRAIQSMETSELYEMLNCKWYKNRTTLRTAASFKALIVALINAESCKQRRVFHRAINIASGAEEQSTSETRAALWRVSSDKDPQIRGVANYLLVEASPPFGLNDEANLRRHRYTKSRIEAVRWLSVVSLSYAEQDFVIDMHAEIVFGRCETTVPSSVSVIKGLLLNDPSTAVRAAAADALAWYFMHGKVSTAEFSEIVPILQADSNSELNHKVVYLRRCLESVNDE